MTSPTTGYASNPHPASTPGRLHPCADHACDHCHTCDNLGICCASVPTTTATMAMTTKPDTGSLTDLRTALAEDAENGQTSLSNLRDLVAMTATDPLIGTASATSLAALHVQDDRLALPSGTDDTAVLQFVRKAKGIGVARHPEPARRSAEDRQ